MLWLDLTSALQHEGRPVGIQRVITAAARGLLADARRERVGFCHSLKKEGFAELSASAVNVLVDRRVASPVVEASWRRRVRRRTAKLLGRRSEPRFPFRRGDALVNLGYVSYSPTTREWMPPRFAELGTHYVGTIYDLIPIRFPEWFGAGPRDFTIEWQRFTGRLSSAVLCISDATRRDAAEFFARDGLETGPLVTIPLPDEISRVSAAPAAKVERPFVLYVSTIEVRKNHRLLFQVWKRLLERNDPARVPSLVFVGRRGWLIDDFLQELENAEFLDGKIVVRFDVDDEELERLYAACLFTVYPSLTEGFGLPLAESLARGKYCVASAAGALPEVGGDLADYHEPWDLETACELVARACFDASYRAEKEARIRAEYRPRTVCGLVDALWRVVEHLPEKRD